MADKAGGELLTGILLLFLLCSNTCSNGLPFPRADTQLAEAMTRLGRIDPSGPRKGMKPWIFCTWICFFGVFTENTMVKHQFSTYSNVLDAFFQASNKQIQEHVPVIHPDFPPVVHESTSCQLRVFINFHGFGSFGGIPIF